MIKWLVYQRKWIQLGSFIFAVSLFPVYSYGGAGFSHTQQTSKNRQAGKKKPIKKTKGVKKAMSQFPPHPGKIKLIELYSNSVREVSADDVPEHSRFVYLKDGVETHDPQEATERIPIVEEHMMSLDAHGNLVPKEQATRIRIKQFGPGQRPLRDTTLVKN